ncbi:DUF1212-domain-containing protein [Stereum hirsutum FP-91666 SS1]|uniref:DUF1212-domain-containing protein n=1 Tax=Stereum hirsutum (strain FP-91666) TaxID=721885 RepID=UPI000444979B|nr:DUF1212-domain-containing protein [Stereum hirsutum FP-91666 SS1]EIM81788.1 DUF1212-domain-containing protein [Stereum hirsutum FP-91666 SS1]
MQSDPSTRVSSPDLEKGEWIGEKSEAIKAARREERRQNRKSAAVFIKRHVAEIIQRQEFVLKLARAMMMFGGPSHRLQAQIQATARVLDISLSCMYLPDVFLISFDDPGTGTSSIKLIRQASTLDIGKLQETNKVYWKATHDEISVKEASEELDRLMLAKPFYGMPAIIFFGGMASASICSVGFNGSLIDSLISFPLGAFVVFIQLIAARNELYSNVFEITMTTLMSFLCGALSASRVFCFPAIVSSSIVLILPGFIVLIGSLELASRQIVAGAVRVGFAIMFSLFFGFGLALGAQIYQRVSHTNIVGIEDYTCIESHRDDLWYRKTPSVYWAFLTVPMFSIFLSLRNMAPWNRKEILPLVLISCIGWVTNHFTATVFVNQLDVSAAVGGFAVGFISNIYGKMFRGNAFVVMITGILFQLPSGLSNNGLLHFASESSQGYSESYLSGFQVALQLISVAIGLTVGLSISLVIVNPILSRRRRSGVFSL